MATRGGAGVCWAGAKPECRSRIGSASFRFMKTNCARRLKFPLLLAGLLALAAPACLAGTAFTYQGNLTDARGPATGLFDLRFSLYDAATSGNVVAGPVTVASVGVTNGLFTVPLDFGAVFNGADRWLQIGVRTNGAVLFTALTPRQWLTAAPWATYAPSAGSAALAAGVATGAITTVMLADGAVTTAKLGSGVVPVVNVDDGGAAAYADLLGAGRGLRGTEALAFSDLSPVSTNGGPPALTFRLNGGQVGTVQGFTGYEALSEVYEYVVEVTTATAQYDPETVVGGQGFVVFARAGRETVFGGLVTGCTRAAFRGQALYTFRLQPPLALLGLRSDYRLFQEQTVRDIVTAVYAQGTGTSLQAQLSGSYPTRTLTTQFAETDLNFFHRLLEHEGIFYLFDLAQTQPTLILGDGSAAYLAAPYDALAYFGNSPTNPRPGQECLRVFQRATRETVRAANLNGYDFTVPRKNLRARSAADTGRGESYEFDAQVTQLAEVEALARTRLQSQRGARNLATGAGNAASLRAGFTFGVSDQSGAGVGGEYVITAIRHAAFLRTTNGVTSLYYGNQFAALPAATPYSPPRQTPRPVVPASTAVVTGPTGEEIWTDQRGRVKVQFHWDRYGAGDQTSSAWIRVATHWAGKNWGSITVPRVGQEVLVEFINGDPDQPVITGSFYNGDNPPPYALPANATQSGLKTHSSKGGGTTEYNELRFEDKKGLEQVFLKAQRNLDLLANNDATFGVGRDLAWSVGNDLGLQVSHDLNVTAGHKLKFTSALGVGINADNDSALALKVGGTLGATLFQGNAGGLTNLPAAALAGTLADAQLSANIPRLNAAQSFTGTNAFLGRVGIGTNAPGTALDVAGTVRATGAIRLGSEAGGTQPTVYPPGSDGLVVRRVYSTTSIPGTIIARTDRLTLERDGSAAGLRISYPASPGRQTICALGVNVNGTQVIARQVLNNPASAGTVTLFTDAQRITHYDISFGNAYNAGHSMQVVLDRYDDGGISDNYLIGTLTTTYNQ